MKTRSTISGQQHEQQLYSKYNCLIHSVGLMVATTFLHQIKLNKQQENWTWSIHALP